jgi:hypothetical protein
MEPDGDGTVPEFLESSHSQFRGATLEKIQQIVATEDKETIFLLGRFVQAFLFHNNKNNKS